MKEKQYSNSTRTMCKVAMMVAFVSVMSFIRIPLPFSEAALTCQTLAVNIIALLLVPKEAFMVMLSYWLLGLVGAPMFSGMGGPGKLFGPGGGYFLAFIPAALLISFMKGKRYCLHRYLAVTLFVGIVVIDGLGMVWLKMVSGMNWEAAFVAGFAAFIPLDIIKCVVACIVVKPLEKALKILEVR